MTVTFCLLITQRVTDRVVNERQSKTIPPLGRPLMCLFCMSHCYYVYIHLICLLDNFDFFCAITVVGYTKKRLCTDISECVPSKLLSNMLILFTVVNIFSFSIRVSKVIHVCLVLLYFAHSVLLLLFQSVRSKTNN